MSIVDLRCSDTIMLSTYDRVARFFQRNGVIPYTGDDKNKLKKGFLYVRCHEYRSEYTSFTIQYCSEKYGERYDVWTSPLKGRMYVWNGLLRMKKCIHVFSPEKEDFDIDKILVCIRIIDDKESKGIVEVESKGIVEVEVKRIKVEKVEEEKVEEVEEVE